MRTEISIWIPGDQLLKKHPALALEQELDRSEVQILLIENDQLIQKYSKNPIKLILVLSAMRHYAQELREAGFQVDYRREASFREGIQRHLNEYGPSLLLCMESCNYQARLFQTQSLADLPGIPVRILPNTQFLVGLYNPYPDHQPEKKVLLEHFYRKMRRHFGILVDDLGNPEGEKWNYDRENRKPLPKDMPIPDPKVFAPDHITQQVIEEVSSARNYDRLIEFNLAATAEQAEQALQDFITHRLPSFGRYEDAMTSRSGLVFHSGLSPYLNLGLLHPLDAIRAVEDAYHSGNAPLNSVEGFIRQVLGWREYIYWQYWRTMPALLDKNHFQASNPLPDFFWDGTTKLNCLNAVLERVLRTGYNHHIERLMVLSNFCTLAGIQPRQVLDWFTAVYLDAYPWVMAPNVLGMGLHADGGGIGTKPYVSSANYINKMSDYCRSCQYNHRKRTGEDACPFNYLYWNFLLGHQKTLSGNPRMNLSLSNLKRLTNDEREKIINLSLDFLSSLAAA